MRCFAHRLLDSDLGVRPGFVVELQNTTRRVQGEEHLENGLGDRVLLAFAVSSCVCLLPIIHQGPEAAIAGVGVDLSPSSTDEIVIMGLFDGGGGELAVIFHD